MARASRRVSASRAAAARPVRSQNRCGCNPGWMVLAIVLLTLGLYSVVAGFVMQFSFASVSAVIPAYFVGVLLLVFGKLSKVKSHSVCEVHAVLR